MQIIKAGKRGTSVSYWLVFNGYSFECDESGRVDETALASRPVALANYRECLASGKASRVEESHNSYFEPAIGKCNHCGDLVHLAGFTNTCDRCETDYNMSGQELAPRSQWGEETGESLSDILRG